MSPWGHSPISGTFREVPKGTIPRGTFGYIRDYCRQFCPHGDISLYRGHPGKNLVPKGTIPRGTFGYIMDYCRQFCPHGDISPIWEIHNLETRACNPLRMLAEALGNTSESRAQIGCFSSANYYSNCEPYFK